MSFNIASTVEASAAAIGAGLGVSAALRGWFKRRRKREAYTRAIKRLITNHPMEFNVYLRQENEYEG